MDADPTAAQPIPHRPDPIAQLAESILKLGYEIHDMRESYERSECKVLSRIEEKIDILTKSFATLQEDKAKMQQLFQLVADQTEKLKKLSV